MDDVVLTLGHHLGRRLGGPIERMSVAVPLSHEGEQAIGERCGVDKIREAQVLTLEQFKELLLDLIHP